MTVKNYKILFSFFLTLVFMTACYEKIEFPETELTLAQRQAELDQIITNEDFEALFKKAAFISDNKTEMNVVLNEPLKKYLKYHQYTPEELIDILERSGFEVKKIKYDDLSKFHQDYFKKRHKKPFEFSISGKKKLPTTTIRYVEFYLAVHYQNGEIRDSSYGRVSSQGL